MKIKFSLFGIEIKFSASKKQPTIPKSGPIYMDCKMKGSDLNIYFKRADDRLNRSGTIALY